MQGVLASCVWAEVEAGQWLLRRETIESMVYDFTNGRRASVLGTDSSYSARRWATLEPQVYLRLRNKHNGNGVVQISGQAVL